MYIALILLSSRLHYDNCARLETLNINQTDTPFSREFEAHIA